MNIDNGTEDDLTEGREVTISQNVVILERGGNYITVQLDDGDELDISDGSNWFIEL